MFRKRLTSITVSTSLFQIEPLQNYIGYLARYAGVPDNRLMQLQVVIEEIFTHIVDKCFQGSADGNVTVNVDVTQASLMLTFEYQGLPFAYSLDHSDSEADEISLHLIRTLSTSYRMMEDGKRGQKIEISIALKPKVLDEMPETPKQKPTDGDNVELRQVNADEMEKMVQCLYRVFGYTYSAEAIYYPDMLRERLRSGLYRGFVAANSCGDIVAHVGMLKSETDDTICECGQAFVSPDYNNRGLFVRLKRMLIDEAERIGLRGVFSSAVTGHPYTQMANLKLGCVETGFELSYIPNNLKSMIAREGEEQRQTVLSFFLPTSHQKAMSVYVPESYRDIVEATYSHLGLERTLLTRPADASLADADSEIEEAVKSDWNQLHIHIHKAGADLESRLRRILRRAMANNTAVAYASLKLTEPDTPLIADTLRNAGFIYSGIMPYEADDCDVLRMQFIADAELNGDYIIALSDWAKEIKHYILKQLADVE